MMKGDELTYPIRNCSWDPTTLTFEIITAVFLIAGILHPLEIKNLFFGIIYIITIPCIYLLLPFYCVFNLDDVSWGTRDDNILDATKKSSKLSEKISDIFTAKKEIESLKRELTEIKEAFTFPKQNIDVTEDEVQKLITKWIEDPEIQTDVL